MQLDRLKQDLDGELKTDKLYQSLYATDASVYRRTPMAVAFPKSIKDLKTLIHFANENKIGLVPRAAGTSLAGQCVGDGIIVDTSRHFTSILDFDKKNKTVTVEPGVIRDDLNRFLKEHGLFFGPNTSTSNRCMIGGMVGNNSSGTTSIKYGVTRDKVLELHAVLADASEAVFNALSQKEFLQKKDALTFEGEIYKKIFEEFSVPGMAKQISENFPKPSIHRRSTGYAIDEIISSEIFSEKGSRFNLCKLLTGSEGTLAFTTQITLKLDELPPSNALMVACHFHSIEDCLNAVAPLMEHDLYNCEMMDKTILDCTKDNREQTKNRFFINGDPVAILMVEIRDHDPVNLEVQKTNLLNTINAVTKSYANPILTGSQIIQAQGLRSAGLGLLGNLVGDRKAVACIEDTAVALEDLADYISEFTALMKRYNQSAVYYAHAGAGELHLRPILNLKKSEDLLLFKKITDDVAKLVKKYKGSMSGEHGDGIVRGAYVKYMIGANNYEILKRLKKSFDPNNIFNPGKIVDAFPMNEKLRYEVDRVEPNIKTLFNFSDSQGILRAVEKCNGSGDCRKSVEAGGTMCPSYRATKNEKDTTRGRANTLREFLTNSDSVNRFNHEELKEVFDLCLSCKGCNNECPSNVDISTLKAEFQYQYYKSNGVPLRSKLFANNNRLNNLGRLLPSFTNFIFKNKISSNILKSLMGVASERNLPLLSKISLKDWANKNLSNLIPSSPIKTVYFFNDEFTNHLDASIGIDALELLSRLNYKVEFVEHAESGRSHISKGLLEEAQSLANKNISIFSKLISEDKPLIGIEPSAILTFRDEYPKLAKEETKAKTLSKNVFLIDEFLQNEISIGNISSEQFTEDSMQILLHGHCHQKALSSVQSSYTLLDLPKNYQVNVIPSGCCGMAGSFGYEKEHYEISMQIGEQTLFPAIRTTDKHTVIAAPGTSCRHQITDGTQRIALHPVSILKAALK